MSIALVVVDEDAWGVDGDVLIVCAEAIAVCIGVGDESCLEHSVGGDAYAWYDVAWAECGLFGFGEVVFDVFVECEFAYFL